MTEEQVDRLIVALERLGATVERLVPTPVDRLHANGPLAWCGRCGTKLAPNQTHKCSGLQLTSQSHPLRLA